MVQSFVQRQQSAKIPKIVGECCDMVKICVAGKNSRVYAENHMLDLTREGQAIH